MFVVRYPDSSSPDLGVPGYVSGAGPQVDPGRLGGLGVSNSYNARKKPAVPECEGRHGSC